MYLHFITRREVEELRHYQVLKTGKESHVYTMNSEEKSYKIIGVYKSKQDAEKDFAVVKKADKEYNKPCHKFVNITTAGRKIYQDQIISYSIKGRQMDTCFASVKNGRILETARKAEELDRPEGSEIMEIVKLDGRFYKINEKPIYSKSSEAEEENA